MDILEPTAVPRTGRRTEDDKDPCDPGVEPTNTGTAGG